jgi:hypothetical protein
MMPTPRSQEPLVKSAIRVRALDKMYFKYPVPFAAQLVQITHRPGILRMDTHQILVARNVSMRELANQMSRDRPTKSPPRILSRALGISIEFCAGNIRRCVIMRRPARCAYASASRRRTAAGQ